MIRRQLKIYVIIEEHPNDKGESVLFHRGGLPGGNMYQWKNMNDQRLCTVLGAVFGAIVTGLVRQNPPPSQSHLNRRIRRFRAWFEEGFAKAIADLEFGGGSHHYRHTQNPSDP